MAKLIFKDDFTLEVGENTYTGELLDLTKKQKKDWDKFNASKKSQHDELNTLYKKITRLKKNIEINEKLESWVDVKSIQKELEIVEDKAIIIKNALENTKDIEDMFKKRIEWSVSSDDKEEILKAGEEYGYRNVFETILRDLKEKKEKK